MVKLAGVGFDFKSTKGERENRIRKYGKLFEMLNVKVFQLFVKKAYRPLLGFK